MNPEGVRVRPKAATTFARRRGRLRREWPFCPVGELRHSIG